MFHISVGEKCVVHAELMAETIQPAAAADLHGAVDVLDVDARLEDHLPQRLEATDGELAHQLVQGHPLLRLQHPAVPRVEVRASAPPPGGEGFSSEARKIGLAGKKVAG